MHTIYSRKGALVLLPLCWALNAGCQPEYEPVNVDGDVRDDDIVLDEIRDSRFSKVCGELSHSDNFGTPEAAAEIVGEVYEGGDGEYRQEGTLLGSGFEDVTERVNDELLYAYMAMSGTAAGQVTGLFDADFVVLSNSFISVRQTHVSNSRRVYNGRAADAVSDYNATHGPPADGDERGYVDSVNLYEWEAIEHRYRGAAGEVKVTEGVTTVEIGGSFYEETGNSRTMFVVDLCIEPMDE